MHDQPARISGRGSASGGPSQYTGQLHAHHHTSQLTAHPTGGFGGCLPLSQLVQHGQGQVLVLQPQGQGQGQGQGQIVSMVNSDGIGLGGGGGARGYGAGGHVMHLIGQSQPQARLSRLSTQTGELVHQKFAVAAEQGSNGGTVAVPSAHVRQVYGVRQAEVLSAQHAQHARHSASAPQQQQQVQQQQQYVSIARQGADGNDMIYIVNGIPMQPMRNVHVVQAPDGVQAIAPLSMQMLNVQGSMRGHGGDEGDDADGYWAMPVQHIQHSWPRPSN